MNKFTTTNFNTPSSSSNKMSKDIQDEPKYENVVDVYQKHGRGVITIDRDLVKNGSLLQFRKG